MKIQMTITKGFTSIVVVGVDHDFHCHYYCYRQTFVNVMGEPYQEVHQMDGR